MAPAYFNFLGGSNHVPGPCITRHPCAELWCYSSEWWPMASDINTCKASERLLLAAQTAPRSGQQGL